MNPGVGTGTRNELISGRSPAVRPVTAVTVTRRVMSVPELVMNCLRPLMTHSPPSSTAVVRVPPASLPACGSVRPNAPSASPVTSVGSHCAFWASVPKRYTGIAPSDTPASRVMATDWSTLPSSSSARHRVK